MTLRRPSLRFLSVELLLEDLGERTYDDMPQRVSVPVLTNRERTALVAEVSGWPMTLERQRNRR